MGELEPLSQCRFRFIEDGSQLEYLRQETLNFGWRRGAGVAVPYFPPAA